MLRSASSTVNTKLSTAYILVLLRCTLGGTLRRVVRHRKPSGAYHHGDLREALLSQALKSIEQHGAAKLSLRDLARRLGVSSAAPYHHFAGRSELLAALAQAGFERLEACMREELNKVSDSPLERLRALGRGYLRFAWRHASHFRLMFRRDCPPGSQKEEHSGAAFQLLRSVVVECLQRANRGDEDPMPSILAMWGCVHGLASLGLDGRLTDADDPAVIDALCENAIQVVSLSLVRP